MYYSLQRTSVSLWSRNIVTEIASLLRNDRCRHRRPSFLQMIPWNILGCASLIMDSRWRLSPRDILPISSTTTTACKRFISKRSLRERGRVTNLGKIYHRASSLFPSGHLIVERNPPPRNPAPIGNAIDIVGRAPLAPHTAFLVASPFPRDSRTAPRPVLPFIPAAKARPRPYSRIPRNAERYNGSIGEWDVRRVSTYPPLPAPGSP